MLLFGAAYAAPNNMLHQIKAQQFYTDTDLYQQCCPTENSSIQRRPLSDFPVLFKADLIFKDFSSKTSKFKNFLSLCDP